MKIKYFIPVAMCIFLLAGCAETSYLEKSMDSVAETSAPVEEEETASEIFVQIEGAVKSPGVYQMKADDRVFSLIDKAGGFRKDAYTADINQAEPLTDGQKLIVLTKREQRAMQTAEADGSSESSSDGKVDINKADAAELTTISGIGPSRAEAIIAYREENGRFSSTDDITKVSGIGESTYNRIKDRIKV